MLLVRVIAGYCLFLIMVCSLAQAAPVAYYRAGESDSPDPYLKIFTTSGGIRVTFANPGQERKRCAFWEFKYVEGMESITFTANVAANFDASLQIGYTNASSQEYRAPVIGAENLTPGVHRYDFFGDRVLTQNSGSSGKISFACAHSCEQIYFGRSDKEQFAVTLDSAKKTRACLEGPAVVTGFPAQTGQ